MTTNQCDIGLIGLGVMGEHAGGIRLCAEKTAHSHDDGQSRRAGGRCN